MFTLSNSFVIFFKMWCLKPHPFGDTDIWLSVFFLLLYMWNIFLRRTTWSSLGKIFFPFPSFTLLTPLSFDGSNQSEVLYSFSFQYYPLSIPCSYLSQLYTKPHSPSFWCPFPFGSLKFNIDASFIRPDTPIYIDGLYCDYVGFVPFLLIQYCLLDCLSRILSR